MKGDIRCIEGRLFRHAPFWDDPDYEVDIGACPGCAECTPQDDDFVCPTCKGKGTINPLTAPAGVFVAGVSDCPTCDGSGEI